MLTQVGKTLRLWRRRISRSDLLNRWLRGHIPERDSHERGLIILQLDGLSREQFDSAVARKRLPFIRRLMDRGYFQGLNSFYSGIPSTTPAVQAEVMYGVKCAVPAFQFLNRKSGRVFRMYESDAAKSVIKDRLASAEPLLTEGASYSNIYSGGADEARGCAETADLPHILKELNPIRLMVVLFLYFFTLLRIAVLTGVELLVGVADGIQGLFTRQWKHEAKFVPARALVSIVLREWVRIVVKLSITRGRPTIYANLLGYDEQSHLRGPSSAFAHWGLKGIDKVIEDIFKASQRSDARDYEVVIFSDHGQEATRIYEFETEQTISQAIQSTLEKMLLKCQLVTSLDSGRMPTSFSQTTKRATHQSESAMPTAEEIAENITVTAVGPIGHVYFPFQVDDPTVAEFANHLVRSQDIPLVLYQQSDGTVWGRNTRGLWQLPQQLAEVCGAEHRFLDELRDDLIRLIQHPDAGNLVLCGWDPERKPMTFAREYGAHGGIGYEETRGFALLPGCLKASVRQCSAGERYVRGIDLHDAAVGFLKNQTSESPQHQVAAGKSTRQLYQASPSLQSANATLRVMTYNTHHCAGMDGKCRPHRIAEVIAEAAPDIVALQEMDQGQPRSGLADQTAMIAAQLGMYHHFFPTWTDGAAAYGLAILSRWPLTVVREGLLPSAKSPPKKSSRMETLTKPRGRQRERRAAVWCSIDTDAGELQFVNTHFGLGSAERLQQARSLLGDEWLGRLQLDHGIIIGGDLNAGPKSEVLRLLQTRFQCAQSVLSGHRPMRTFASVMPLRQIDHVLVSRDLRVQKVVVPRNHRTRMASDHLPVCVQLQLTVDSERSGLLSPDSGGVRRVRPPANSL